MTFKRATERERGTGRDNEGLGKREREGQEEREKEGGQGAEEGKGERGRAYLYI